jgi:hypothetical protein
LLNICPASISNCIISETYPQSKNSFGLFSWQLPVEGNPGRPVRDMAEVGRPIQVVILVEFGSFRFQELRQLHPGHGPGIDGLRPHFIKGVFSEFREFIPIEKVYGPVPGVIN